MTFRRYYLGIASATTTGGYVYSQEIANCTIQEPSTAGTGGGMFFERIDGANIHDNTINLSGGNNGFYAISMYASRDDQYHIANSRIVDNTIQAASSATTLDDAITYHNSDTDPEYSITGESHLIEGNTFLGYWSENCVDAAAAKLVVKGNSFGKAGAGTGACNLGGYGDLSTYNRVVDNVFKNGWTNIAQTRIGSLAGPTQVLRNIAYGSGVGLYLTDIGTDADDIYVFHNTFDHTGSGASPYGPIRFSVSSDSIVQNYNQKNNIFYVKSGCIAEYIGNNETVSGNSYDGNLYYILSGVPADLWYYGGSNRNLAYIQGTLGVEASAVEDNPDFTDQPSRDYTLQAGSPAIDAGVWLTTITTANGSGTTFTAADPNWFYDGWGISGETGDVIKTENGQSATITSINYSTGEITVGSSISWTQNEGIGLDYDGSGPDIGAEEVTVAEGSGSAYYGLGGGSRPETDYVTGGVEIIITVDGTTLVDPFTNDIRAAILAATSSSESEVTGWALLKADSGSWSQTGITRTDSTSFKIITPETLTFDLTEENATISFQVPDSALVGDEAIDVSNDLTISVVQPASSGMGLSQSSNGTVWTQDSNGISITIE